MGLEEKSTYEIAKEISFIFFAVLEKSEAIFPKANPWLKLTASASSMASITRRDPDERD